MKVSAFDEQPLFRLLPFEVTLCLDISYRFLSRLSAALHRDRRAWEGQYPGKEMSLMKGRRWVVLPVAGLAAIIIGIVAVEAAPSPSPSARGAENLAPGFVRHVARSPPLKR